MLIGDLVLYDQLWKGKHRTWRAVVIAARPGVCSIFAPAWARAVTVGERHLRQVARPEWDGLLPAGDRVPGGAA